MNKKLLFLGIMLLIGLTMSGCVTVGGYGYGYDYGYSYYGNPHSSHYYNYGHPYRDYRGYWDGHRHWR
jgi:hypothetical protein